ncbi:uncharacterized protein LOC119587578, partial [Penaeus monodon]|uniref:uncharacterized protein LOC119587578 n=1 Tax=Penaeus monodon TaxID=6687 RepID=UPI0018A7B5A9
MKKSRMKSYIMYHHADFWKNKGKGDVVTYGGSGDVGRTDTSKRTDFQTSAGMQTWNDLHSADQVPSARLPPQLPDAAEHPGPEKFLLRLLSEEPVSLLSRLRPNDAYRHATHPRHPADLRPNTHPRHPADLR